MSKNVNMAELMRCDCGSEFFRKNLPAHLRSEKHIRFLKAPTPPAHAEIIEILMYLVEMMEEIHTVLVEEVPDQDEQEDDDQVKPPEGEWPPTEEEKKDPPTSE